MFACPRAICYFCSLNRPHHSCFCANIHREHTSSNRVRRQFSINRCMPIAMPLKFTRFASMRPSSPGDVRCIRVWMLFCFATVASNRCHRCRTTAMAMPLRAIYVISPMPDAVAVGILPANSALISILQELNPTLIMLGTRDLFIKFSNFDRDFSIICWCVGVISRRIYDFRSKLKIDGMARGLKSNEFVGRRIHRQMAYRHWKSRICVKSH